MLHFTCNFAKSDQQIPVIFEKSDQSIGITFNESPINNSETDEVYEGPYQITPGVESQSIPTAQKFMSDDVIVKAIPFSIVSNTSGGTTAYIGKEVD